LARRATAIEQIRTEAQGTVLVFDTGDTLFGRPGSDKDQGALPIAAMGAMGYDAMALGEIDLGAKAEILRERFQEAGFPILSANLGPDDVLNIHPYILFEVEGHTVAIVGATATRAAQKSDTVGVTLEIGKPRETLPLLIEELRDQADIIIVLSNLIQQTNVALAQEVAGIDVIIGTRDGMPPTQVQHIDGPDGRVILQGSGRQGQQLAVLEVHFDADGQVALAEGQGLVLSNDYAEDPEMLQLIEQYSAGE
jgi:2',3'-cyclic-nucleotide 2'-phosphodiesterase (5'-nucleotidase family)